MDQKSISERYAGKSVFITGGTGFLGKVLLEKLLYACPHIEFIFILMRIKNKTSVEQRLNLMLELPVFTRIKKENPECWKKIVPVVGDICYPALGLAPKDEQMLMNSVSIVFHSAATVRFNEKLDDAININVKGTERVLDLCKRMSKLEVLVHVSSTYTNTHEEYIDEILYAPPIPIENVKYIFGANLDDEQLKHLLGSHPNTYTFSKSIAENILVEKHEKVPLVIVRPSIVSASKEDLPGWIDNWNGASALMVAITKGLNRTLLGSGTNILDLIPVDYVANLLIVAGARCQCTTEPIIYNSCTSSQNPLTLQDFFLLLREDNLKNRDNEMLYPTILFTNSKLILWFITLLLQTIPAYLGDIVLRIMGRKARFTKLQAYVMTVRNALEYFTSHSWKFQSNRTQALYTSLSETDKGMFPISPTSIEWREYITIYCAGLRKYLIR